MTFDDDHDELQALWDQLIGLLNDPRFDRMLDGIEAGFDRDIAGSRQRRERHVGVYDPVKRRRCQRQARQRGCAVYVPAVELKHAGVDPHRDAWYRVYPGRGTMSVIVRFYYEQ